MSTILEFDTVDEHGPLRFHEALELSPAELDREEIERISPVSVEGVLEPGDLTGEYLVSGEIAYTADLVCARCLEPFPFANRSSFHLRYVPRTGPEAGSTAAEELEVAPEELDVETYGERRIDLAPLVQEQVQLSLPMKPLCEEGCLGLCPVCGANRNRGACDCAGKESDPRWDALRGIRDELARKKDI